MKISIRLLVLIISVLTLISGMVQVIAPAFVLHFVGAEVTPTAAHFFGIVGMFMALFGGLMIHALYSVHTNEVAVLWCALQKLGAFVAVGLGIFHDIFSIMAAAVALFDLFSGLLFLYYLKTLKDSETA
jgi:hypothetical protein